MRDAHQTDAQVDTDNPAAQIETKNVYILTTNVQDCLMAAAYITRTGAMAAAIGWVEGEAKTRLSGSLDERYEKARQHLIGQRGQMEIIKSSIRRATNDYAAE